MNRPTFTVLAIGTSLSIATVQAIRVYHRRYSRGRIVSLRDYICTYSARRRMQRVIQTMLPLWKSRYDDSDLSSLLELRRSDVVVSAPPKSGTTWVTHICHQIRTHGKDIVDQDVEDQDDIVPWMERLGTPYLDGTRFNNEPNADHVVTQRVFKSHLTWKERHAGPHKQIWVFRDCVDMMVSVTHFLPSLWGISHPLTEEEMCSFLLDAGDVESALTSLVSVWRHRHDDNVLLLFYESMLEDHKGAVEKIAKFMGVKLTSAEIDRIVDQSSKREMLAHHEVFACRKQARNAYRARGLVLDETRLVGKVRRRNGDAESKVPCNLDHICAATKRAWQYVVAEQIGFADYECMRQAWK